MGWKFYDSCGDYRGANSSGFAQTALRRWGSQYLSMPTSNTATVAGRGGIAYSLQNANRRLAKDIEPSPRIAIGAAILSSGSSPGNYRCSVQFGVGTPQSGLVVVAEVRIAHSGAVQIMVGPTVVLETAPMAPLDEWFYLQAEIDVPGGKVAARINTMPVVEYAGSVGSDPVNVLAIGESGANELNRLIDDVYIHRPDGSEPAMLGPQRVVTGYVTSDVITDFVPNSGDNVYSRINNQASINDASYATGEPGDQTTHTLQNLTDQLGYVPRRIHGVQLVARMMPEGGSPEPITGIIESGSSVANVVFNSLPADSVFSYIVSETQQVDPNTGQAWTINAVNNLVAGLRIEGGGDE